MRGLPLINMELRFKVYSVLDVASFSEITAIFFLFFVREAILKIRTHEAGQTNKRAGLKDTQGAHVCSWDFDLADWCLHDADKWRGQHFSNVILHFLSLSGFK